MQQVKIQRHTTKGIQAVRGCSLCFAGQCQGCRVARMGSLT